MTIASPRFTLARLALVAAVLWLVPAAARAQVFDNAHIFGESARSDAESATRALNDKFGKQLIVETFAAVPPNGRDAVQRDKAAYFHDWLANRAKAHQTDGVFVLICMNPGHVQVGSGDRTRAKGMFSAANDRALEEKVRGLLDQKQNDAALSAAVQYVSDTYMANVPAASTPRGQAARNEAARPSPSANTTPSGQAAPSNAPGRSSSGSDEPAKPSLFHSCGKYLCLGIVAIIVIAVVRSFMRRSGRGGPPSGGAGFGGGGGGGYAGGGGSNYPTGGPGVQQTYGNPNMGGGGGGGGFGRGLLGGLLGGAVGGYAADKFEHRNDPVGGGAAAGGGYAGGGDTGSASGGGFDSGPSDAGQGFGDASAGGDFGGGSSSDGGSVSSGGDFGGGGGDSGGGDSGGGGGDGGSGF